MKKMALFSFLLVLATGGILFAQTVASITTISGALGLSGGNIAVQSGNVTYYVRGLDRFVGFIDGLKYGVQVSLEGYASDPSRGQTERLFYPVKMTLNGKEYEVGSEDQSSGQDGSFPSPNRPSSGPPPGPGSRPKTPGAPPRR
jgi:hypothetical protein